MNVFLVTLYTVSYMCVWVYYIAQFSLCTTQWVNRTTLLTGWLIQQVFLAYTQTLTFHNAGNGKFLTAHISKFIF